MLSCPQSRFSLDILNVPSPCTALWKSMTGSDKIRHCSKCQKNVYNLSAMSAAEADTLLGAGIETPCVRFYRRLDGTVVTTDRCGNWTARMWRRFTTTVGAMLVTLAALAGCDCSKLGICTQGKPAPRAATTPPPAEEPEVDDEP